MAKVGVVLSGCGVYDGAEIHEATLTLYFLDNAGAQIICMAPDGDQMHVINHLKGEPTGEKRNIMVESARIARGEISDMKDISTADLDALVFPGGFGAAKNLCDFAVKGADCSVHPQVSSQQVRIDVFDLAGRSMGTPVNQVLKAGFYQFAPVALLGNQLSHQLYLIKVKNGSRTTAHTILSSISKLNESGMRLADQSQAKSLGKLAAGVDVLKVTAQGYQPYSQDLPSYSDTGLSIQLSSATVCVTSTAMGSCGPYASVITGTTGSTSQVGNDVWNPVPGYSQTLYATDAGNWHVMANMPAGNTAVVSYPNVWQTSFSPTALSDFSSIYSSFSENLQANTNGGTVAEAGYDIWLNNWANEVMIQTDFVGDALRPRCSGSQVIATVPFGGSGGVPVQNWNLCQFGSEVIWQFPTGTNESSGTVDILAMLNWLVNHGYIRQGSVLDNGISWGFEICSTGGVAEDFRVNGFSITATRSH